MNESIFIKVRPTGWLAHEDKQCVTPTSRSACYGHLRGTVPNLYRGVSARFRWYAGESEREKREESRYAGHGP